MGGSTAPSPPDHNAGMAAMANSSMMSSLYQSNAKVAVAGLQSATQMFQANIMYMVQSEAIDAKRDIAFEDIELKRDKAEMRHDEVMARIRNEEMEIQLEAQEAGLEEQSTYNPFVVR